MLFELIAYTSIRPDLLAGSQSNAGIIYSVGTSADTINDILKSGISEICLQREDEINDVVDCR